MSVNVLLRLCKGLMVIILASSMIYRGFDPLLVTPETITFAKVAFPLNEKH